jgi:hypothetical protein
VVRLARAWKDHYAKERATLGEKGLDALFDRAPDVALPSRGALVFPHTHLRAAGHFVAAAARAVVRSGSDRVLAIGVLHHARAIDAPIVARARAGDESARAIMRRVHGPGVAGDDERWSEEYSLDNFTALVARAARREGRAPPRVVARFPFLADDDPESVPGVDELARFVDAGCALVGTADAIHHGVGYDTPENERLAIDDAGTKPWAVAAIDAQYALLASGQYAAFQEEAARARSDFRDAGPVLAMLLRRFGRALAARVVGIELVDYAETLDVARPTWVAAPLTELRTSPAT